MSWVGGGAHEEKGGTGTTLRIKKFGKVQLKINTKKVPATNKSICQNKLRNNLPNQNWFPTLQNGRSANESSFRRLLPYLRIQTSNTVSNSVAKADHTEKT
jgi:hypothetical protein